MIGLVGMLAWRQREIEAGSEPPEDSVSVQKSLAPPPALPASAADLSRPTLDASRPSAQDR
jgi:hypothetical protein